MAKKTVSLGALDFPFRVEEWSDDGQNIVDTIAGATHWDVAIAAYEAAVRANPRRRITLRHGIRVTREHKPQEDAQS